MTVNMYRAAVVILLIAVAALAGVLLTGHNAPAAGTSTVSTFNDGFATGKQDDCQQGFAPACTWLRSS